MTSAMLIHIGNASVALLSDAVFSIDPWWLTSRVTYLPKSKRWGVAMSMALVGVSFLVGIAKMTILRLIPLKEHGDVDYTCEWNPLSQKISAFLTPSLALQTGL